jgi:transposase
VFKYQIDAPAEAEDALTSNRLNPWSYNLQLYKKRNEIERLFRRLKGFRRIFSRFEKLDIVFLAFIHFALIVEALRVV